MYIQRSRTDRKERNIAYAPVIDELPCDPITEGAELFLVSVTKETPRRVNYLRNGDTNTFWLQLENVYSYIEPLHQLPGIDAFIDNTRDLSKHLLFHDSLVPMVLVSDQKDIRIARESLIQAECRRIMRLTLSDAKDYKNRRTSRVKHPLVEQALESRIRQGRNQWRDYLYNDWVIASFASLMLFTVLFTYILLF